MHVVVINSWKEATPELAQEIAGALGMTAFDVQQRMVCGTPTVLASFADSQQAKKYVIKLNQIGIATMLIETEEVRHESDGILVRHFQLNESSLHIETGDGRSADIPYEKVDVLLPARSTLTYSEMITTTKNKLSLGQTILTGIPISKKVEKEQEITSETSKKVLYLFVSRGQKPLIFSQEGMTYTGLGDNMKLSRGQNFNFLLNELHRLCPGAAYDDRLLQRIGQVRLLGSTLNPETHLNLAVEILVNSLRRSRTN